MPDLKLSDIASAALDAAKTWPWVLAPLTLPRGQAYILQHVLRNRFFSSVMRPAWMSRCPDQAIVRRTISQMGEELVYDPAIKAAHTKILWQMGRNVGLTDAQMDATRPEPETAAALALLEHLARDWHWTVGWLGSSIDEFVLTALPGHNFHPDRWIEHLGLSEEQVFFFRYHLSADLEHAGIKVWRPMEPWLTPEVEGQIRRGLPLILEAQRQFYAGVERQASRLAAGETPAA
jgi:hypothetical protein